MLTLHPQFVKDTNGKKSFVVLSAKEFDKILDRLDELEDIRLYDEAKKNDTGERIPMHEAFRLIEEKRAAKK